VGVIESDALPGQQKGAVEPILGQGQRTKASGVGRQCLAFGPAPLGQGQPAGDQRQDQHRRQASKQAP
jgi:hypothetical protein